MEEVHWLSGVIESAVRKNWCVSIGCTTCGAMEFRRAIRRELLREQKPSQCNLPGLDFPEQSFSPRLTEDEGAQLIRQLVDVAAPWAELDNWHSGQQGQVQWSEAVQLVVYECWRAFGESDLSQVMFHELDGTYAGSVLDRMISHDASRRRKRDEALERNSPQRKAERKAERLARKAAAHQQRLLHKVKRDERLAILGEALYGPSLSKRDLFKKMAAARVTLAFDRLRGLD